MVTVTHGGGRLITNINAVLIFVRTDPTDWVDMYGVPGIPVPVSFVCEMTSFVSDLVDSAYLDAIGAAYSLPSVKIGRGTFGGTFYLDVAPAPTSYGIGPADVLDEDIQQAIVDGVALNLLPAPNANTVYIVLPPAEVLWRDGLTGTSNGGGGYHGIVRLTRTSAAPYCVIGSSSPGPLAITHELVEAITDPDLGTGWVDRTQNPQLEVADICFPGTVTFHGQDVSTFWSPVAGKCVGPVDDSQRKPAARVRIGGGRAYCDGGIVAGAEFPLSADVHYLGAPELVVSYRWYSADAQVNPVFGPTPTATAPAATGAFDVELSVTTAHGCIARTKRTFVAVTQDQSKWSRRLCQMMKHLPRKPPVLANPLWDPLRDLLTHPLSEEEIGALSDHVQHLGRLIEHIKSFPKSR